MPDIQLLIGGESRPASNGKWFDRGGRSAAATVDDALAAVAAAQAALPLWAALGPNERRTRLLDAAAGLHAAGADLVGLMMSETGASRPWADFNLKLACSLLREAAAMTTQIDGQVIPSDKPGCLAMAVREPHGVVLGIAPWNAPIILCVRAMAMPLACGNTVVLKASELCPGTHRLIGQIFADAGLPPGAVNVITHAPEDAPAIVSALIAHPDVRHVNFTGSSAVGRIIGAQAGRHLKPALLELGGKSPLIVLDDADLDAAVNAAAFGAFMHSGQICMSTERIVVQARVADEFAARLARKVAALPVGDPAKGPAILGPLISEAAADKVEALIADAVAQGARRLCGGRREGAILDGTVLDHVTPAMKIYAEESFGPVVGIVRCEGDDEAVRLANDSDYGLAAAIFSRDIARAMRMARRIDSGICHINGPTVQDEAHMPFGGVKASGVGRFGGRAGIDAFTRLRWMTIETQEPHYPF